MRRPPRRPGRHRPERGGVALPGGVEGAAPGLAQQAGAAVGGEVVFAQLARAKALPHPQVHARAQRLDQVAGHRFAPVGRAVVGAQQRVQPGGVAGLHRLYVQQRVGQRQRGVGGVARRASVAPGKAECRRQHRGQRGEVRARGAALQPTQRVGVGGAAQARQRGSHGGVGVEQRLARVGPGGGPVRDRAALPRELGAHDLTRKVQRPGRIQHPPGLRQPHGGGVVRGAQHGGHAPAQARTEQHRGHAGFGQAQQHAAVQPRAGAVDDAALEQVHRHRAAALPRFVQGQCVAFAAHFELGAVEQQGGHGAGEGTGRRMRGSGGARGIVQPDRAGLRIGKLAAPTGLCCPVPHPRKEACQ
jgi:hypothetical protein